MRPALIVQADGLNTGLPQLVVSMISSRTMRANHASRVLVSRATREGRQSGLLVDSVVMTDNMATVALNAISRIIGTLPTMHENNKLGSGLRFLRFSIVSRSGIAL